MGTGWKGNFQEGKGQFPQVRQGEAARRGNSRRSGRERQQAGAVIPGAKTLKGLIPPSVGKILSLGSSALPWGGS